MDDAWWTGRMLATLAATLPRGHFLIDPYLYDVTMQCRFDIDGVRRSGLADEPISRNGISRGASLGRTP